tara:strand:- start:239 stop:580 length:342 start_codon:yes stop_codon:yes gene_type:complete
LLLDALLNTAPTTTATYNGTSIKALFVEALFEAALELSPRALCSTYTCLAFIATALDIKKTSPPSIKAATRSPPRVFVPLDTDFEDDALLLLLSSRRRIANLLLLLLLPASAS